MSATDNLLMEPTLKTLLETDSLKWIFVGGKGGVGKTTTSSSIAVSLAEKREKVLILSTDPAHNLSDAFSQRFNNTPTLVNGFNNLYAMEIDSSVQETMEFKLEDDFSGFQKFIPDLISSFPGIDEALSFAELMNSVRSIDYSVIVFDTAPTGHTLRLIGFPELLEKGLSKLINLREKMSSYLSMVSTVAGDVINEEEKIDSLKAITATIRSHFQDPSLTTFVCVCIPEFLSVYETERLVQELMKHHIDTSHIVVNQVLFPLEKADAIKIDPNLLTCETNTEKEKNFQNALEKAINKIFYLETSFLSRRKMQSKYLVQIRDLYSEDFHVVSMPLQPNEIRGIDNIKDFAKLLNTPRDLPIITDE